MTSAPRRSAGRGIGETPCQGADVATERVPAEALHPSVFIQEQLDARGWTLRDLAARMAAYDYNINLAALEMYLAIGPDQPSLRIGQRSADRMAHAFGVSAEYFLNLERAWLKHREHQPASPELPDAPASQSPRGSP